MPLKNLPTNLNAELSKLARLSNVQNALPPVMRSLPLIAIFAGTVISNVTGGVNGIEKRILGPDETSFLNDPSRETPSTMEEDGKR
jgi:hypothetical protein